MARPHRLLTALAVMSGVALAGCAVVSLPEQEPGGWDDLPAWPPPPEAPRLVWVGELRSTDDIVLRRGWAQSVAGWVAGRREPLSFSRPMDVAVAGDFLLVADPGLGGVVELDLRSGDHRLIRTVDDQPLVSPVGIAGAPDGRACFTDSALPLVACGRAGGSFHALAGEHELQRPTGVAVEPGGRVLVTDTLAHRVLSLGPEGAVSTAFGERGEALGQFNFPLHLLIDTDGTVVVVDALNARIQRLDLATGAGLSAFGTRGDVAGHFVHPKGVARDSGGHLYVTDGGTSSLQIFDRKGRLLLALGGEGAGPGQFSLPAGITIDSEDRVFVADSLNGRIQIFRHLRRGEP